MKTRKLLHTVLILFGIFAVKLTKFVYIVKKICRYIKKRRENFEQIL